ncbi:LPXTG cell wall anchor domain-containing protein [Streptomyces sp. NPDC058378]|uniref:LPXTG cell wall anchor domain-containing protein n=1 Tax=Streptomyces sp. NPDC058378 TaxID=3346469 RepID=UPI00366319AC
MTKKTRIRVARIAAGAVIAAGASLTAAGAAQAVGVDVNIAGLGATVEADKQGLEVGVYGDDEPPNPGDTVEPPNPGETPTEEPPTEEPPTEEPPTEEPPTEEPPTEEPPTEEPTDEPTDGPTDTPTEEPTDGATGAPTGAPSDPSYPDAGDNTDTDSVGNQPVEQGKGKDELAETGAAETTFLLIGAATMIAGGIGFRILPRLAGGGRTAA